MRFISLTPTADDWARMTAGIDTVNRHSAPHLRQTVDDVKKAIDAKQAAWFVVVDNGKILSDMIVKTLIEETRRTLYVWLMFGSRLDKWAKFAKLALVDLKTFNGCDRIKFHTSRPGWVRLIKDEGENWSHTHVFYLND